jgi:FkbM family methyltransferase
LDRYVEGYSVTLTSYAQNFEDVILWRALKHVQHGRYIDIGAQDPVVDSVSLAFYEVGWRGVHVEPTPHYADLLRKMRPGDEIVEAAISNTDGAITFFELPDTGLSTGDEEIARQHEEKGHAVRRIDVPALPLSKLLDAQRENDIHWLKIDVEGMEELVIAGWSPSPVRPWIVLVESTRPTSSEVSYSAWEPQLVALGYEFVYFDGLNRFYVSIDHPELKASFGPGPNIFDDFTLSGLASAPFTHRINREKAHLTAETTRLTQALNTARMEADAVRAERDAARHTLQTSIKAWEETKAKMANDISRKDNEISSSNAELIRLRQELNAVYRSTSWRLTAPIRLFRRGIGRLMEATSAISHPSGRARTVESPPTLKAHTAGIVQSTSPTETPLGVQWPTGAGGGLIVIDQSDISKEPENVRRIYRQLVNVRKQILRRS